MSAEELAARETGGAILRDATDIIAANVYLGAGPIAQALDQGADIVVTGRVADSALALGPLIHAFGWRSDDWDRLAAGTLAGHLLECGAQVTGGYFADPPYKDVPGMADLGYPIAEIDADGEIVITKPAGTGGRVDRLTVIEQLLYEIHDPAAYLAPDVVLDVDRGDGRGARARSRARTRRARQAGARDAQGHRLRRRRHARRSRDFLRRPECRGARAARRRNHRASACGRGRPVSSSAPTRSAWSACSATTAAHWRGHGRPMPADVRLRFAAQSANAAEVELLLDEVEALYCAGPAGGAGVRRRMTPRLASASCLIERKFAAPRVTHARGRRMTARTVKLHEIANARSGDKGNRLNIALVCRDPAHYPTLAQQVTADRVAEVFAARKPSRVVRYDLPKLAAFNFVLDDVLEGGVNASLGLDGHGKSLSFLLLDIPCRSMPTHVDARRRNAHEGEHLMK